MSILHVLTLPRSVSASAIGGIRSRLIARQFSDVGSTGLMLTPLENALFGFCILFALLTLVQLGCAVLMLVIRRRPESDYRGRIPFLVSIILGLLWLLISFVLAAIINSQNAIITILLPIGVYYAAAFAELASPVFWYAGLVFLLFQRDDVEAFSGVPKGTNATGVITRVVASVLLFVMLVAAIICQAVSSYIVVPDSPLIKVVNAFFYLYLAAYEVLTILIVALSAFLWNKRNPQSSSPTLNRFDSNIKFFTIGGIRDLDDYLSLHGHPGSIRACN
ncbi:hypothetical protein F5887DRAFT_969505 [Amanita rubescens]|nr:hypothetical protein F5887DRAFT_969505 [Amanita rubescens]